MTTANQQQDTRGLHPDLEVVNIQMEIGKPYVITHPDPNPGKQARIRLIPYTDGNVSVASYNSDHGDTETWVKKIWSGNREPHQPKQPDEKAFQALAERFPAKKSGVAVADKGTNRNGIRKM